MTRVRFPIHHTFGPLVTEEQWKLAFRLQCEPWRWQEGPECETLRSELSRSFGASVSLFGSGRDALLASLRALELKAGEEVIVQGFTCIVVPNAIHAAGGVPVYADIDPQTLNLDLEKVQRSITSRTRAVICQHTFGISVDTKRLRAICDKRKLALIEDAAHVIPDSGGNAQLSLIKAPSAGGGIGMYGDVLIFSFGRDKAISGVTGGAALTRHPYLAERLHRMEEGAVVLSHWQILNYLGYPLRYHFAKMIWGTKLAKAYLQAIRLLRLLPAVLTQEEKEGRMGVLIHRLPNVCAALALQQLRMLSSFNDHRRKLTALYGKSAREHGWQVPSGATGAKALQKFPLFVKDALSVREKLKREHIYLDDGWHSAVINPPSVQGEAAGYLQGSCPLAEDVAAHILTLPTHPTMTEEQAKYLVHALGSLLG